MSDRKLELSYKIQERILIETRQELQDALANLLASQNEVDVLNEKVIALTEYKKKTVDSFLKEARSIIDNQKMTIAAQAEKIKMLQTRVQNVSREYNEAYSRRSPITWSEDK